PTGRCRLKQSTEIRPHVEITRAGAAAEPFHGTACSKINIESAYVYRQDPCRLIEIGDDESACFVGASGDRIEVKHRRTTECDMGNRHKLRFFIDRCEHAIEWDSHAVG